MINLSRKSIVKESGAATLIITISLLLVSTMIIIFASGFNRTQQKTTANMVSNNQAFAAAEAGLEFGIVYLRQNSTAILASPVSGYISYSNASTTNITLASGSRFSVVYTNPIANNYNLILITSTGVSGNNASTRVVSQRVQFGSLLVAPSSAPLVAHGNMSLGGSSNIVNTTSGTTIQTGGTVTLTGSSSTTTSGGTSSTAGNIQSDIQANNSTIAAQSSADFFATYFGNSSSNIKSSMANVYTNSSNTNYSSTLNGMTGTSIWIEQTDGTVASISGNTTIGSAANPVLLIVNGNFSLSGNITIYGYIFVFGTNTIDSVTGNVQIFGGLASAGNLNITGSTTLTYNPTVLSNLQHSSSMQYYAKVPGTWKDF